MDINIVYADYGDTPEAVRDEIDRNLRFILAIPRGTCPLYRDFGLDLAALDSPIGTAGSQLSADIIEAVEQFEPRVRVRHVSVEGDVSGALKVFVEVVVSRGA